MQSASARRKDRRQFAPSRRDADRPSPAVGDRGRRCGPHSDLARGSLLDVLVDPRQPGYAKLPGARDVSSDGWTLGVVVAVGPALYSVRRAFRLRHAPAVAHWTGGAARPSAVPER